jgi:hypothetical protein
MPFSLSWNWKDIGKREEKMSNFKVQIPNEIQRLKDKRNQDSHLLRIWVLTFGIEF